MQATTTRRKIIEIDRELCNGCGLCTTACMEGALELDADGKAVLVREIYCDGMGACLDVCAPGALRVVEREVAAYDPKATHAHVLRTRGEEAARLVHGAAAQSELTHWPIQLHLVPPFAPYLQGADLLVAADCTAFALGSFHQELLRGKRLVIACPKLDDTSGYVRKLTEILRSNEIRSLTVAIMVVPCCSALYGMVEAAAAASGTGIVPSRVVVGIDGKII